MRGDTLIAAKDARLGFQEGDVGSSYCDSLAAFVVVLGVGLPCFAQPQPGPATLEDLADSGAIQGTATDSEREPAGSGPNRPAGTVVRPKDGVQHPDLDKAWAEYDETVAKAAKSVWTAISQQFDAAAAKGDLDTAEIWQEVLKEFEKSGEVPSRSETKAAVSAAVADCRKARDELATTYEAVVKALTKEKRIPEAKGVRNEWQVLGASAKDPVVDIGARPTVMVRYVGMQPEVAQLRTGCQYFANRPYTLGKIPDDLEGLAFTRRDGGRSAEVTISLRKAGTVYVLVDSERGVNNDQATTAIHRILSATGWRRLPDIPVQGSGKPTPLAVFYRALKPDDKILLPAGSFSGVGVVSHALEVLP